jgi:L-asparaginase
MRSDAPRNLLNAIEVATGDCREVLVVFGDRILRAVHASKDSIFHFDAFRANNAPTWGRIGLGIEYYQKTLRKKKYWIDTRLNSDIALFTLFPGQSPQAALSVLKNGIRALLIEAFGAGNIPLNEHSWQEVLQKARELRVPVVIGTQCRHGIVNPTLYSGGRKAREEGACFAFGMTRETMVVKTMVLLGRRVSYRKFKKEFERNWMGELVEASNSL